MQLNEGIKLTDALKRRWANFVSDKKFSEILTGSVWALSASVISSGLAMITSIIIARVYGAEMIGIVAMITSFLSLITIFTVLGTNTSILRLIPEHMAKYSPTSAFHLYRKIQYFVASVSLLVGGLLFLFSDIVAEKLFSKPHLSFFYALSAVFLVFSSIMNLNTHAVRGLRLIRTFAFMQLLPSASKIFILLIITYIYFDPNNPVYALFASFLITAIAGMLIIHFDFKKKIQPSDALNNMSLKYILSISLPMLMTSTMTFAISQTGLLMLGMFRSEVDVGYYSIAVKLATLTTFVLSAINTMAAPKFSELFHSGNMAELFYVAQKSTKLIFWTTSPILTGLLLSGKPILKIVFGPEFTEAYGPMVLLVIGQFVNSISGSTGYFLNMTGNQKIFRNIILGAAAVNVGLNLVLIPSFGILGAAFSSMVSVAAWNIIALLYIKFKYGKIIGYLPCIVCQ